MATFNWVISTTEYDLQPADMDAVEASLQANIDGQIDPVTATGVPW